MLDNAESAIRPWAEREQARTGSEQELFYVCSITSTDNGFPLHVKITSCKTTGFVELEHLKSLDYEARQIEFIERAQEETITEVLSRLATLF